MGFTDLILAQTNFINGPSEVHSIKRKGLGLGSQKEAQNLLKDGPILLGERSGVGTSFKTFGLDSNGVNSPGTLDCFVSAGEKSNDNRSTSNCSIRQAQSEGRALTSLVRRVYGE